MRIHTLKFSLVSMFLLLFLANGCHAENHTALPISEIAIGEYLLRVESAEGDQHNVRILYSIRRQDEAKMNPTAQFASLTAHDTKRSFGGSIRYFLSNDGKAIWIEEKRSSPQIYDSKEMHTVTFENLIFGDDSDFESINGKWTVSFRIQIDEEYTELLDRDLIIQASVDESLYYQLSSIQLSSTGIHMKMTLPDNDIDRLTNTFEAALLLKNESVINLELHHSIRGNRSPFDATAEAMFQESVALDEIYAIIICGKKIIVDCQ